MCIYIHVSTIATIIALALISTRDTLRGRIAAVQLMVHLRSEVTFSLLIAMALHGSKRVVP